MFFRGTRVDRKRKRLGAGIYLIAVVAMNIVIYPAIIAWTLVGMIFFPFGFVIWRVLTGWEGDRIMRHFVWIYGRGWISLMAPFVRFKREGFKENKIVSPCIIVVNHLSFFDTYCMGLLPFSDIAFAIRSWPFKMFWYAPFMRLAAYLDLETLGWEGTLKESNRIFSKGGSILFFPEGHRSKDGEVQRFYSGPFKLAIETGMPILSLCITGTDVLLPPDRWWFMPATICLRALPMVYPEEFTGDTAHVNLRKHVKGQITENLHKMREGQGSED